MADNSINSTKKETQILPGYDGLLSEVVALIEQARRTSIQTVNAIMTATYWRVGQRIVEVEQTGEGRAEYGEMVITRLACDLTGRFGRGFARSNLYQMRGFYLAYREIVQTVSGQSSASQITGIVQTVSGLFSDSTQMLARRFVLPWSAYVRLLAVRNESARHFFETEALRGGWSVRQLNRQIESQFYERTALSRNKGAMLAKGAKAKPDDMITPEQEIRDPYVLEFLDLKDEYSESEAMVRYALEGLSNKVLAAEYRTALPSELVIAEEMEKARKQIDKKTSGMLPS